MRVALAQINTVVGDLEGNVRRVLGRLAEAEAAGADLLICPELCVLGYPPKDLLDRPAVVERTQLALASLVRHTRRTALLVGTVLPNVQPVGQRTFNSAVLARDGRIVAQYHKQLLPSYDVFDETRYFEPGQATVLATVADRSIGISICEDIWNLEGNWNTVRYAVDPVATQVAAGAELLMNISASPYYAGKLQTKEQLLVQTARRYHRPIFYVNQVGGNDSLIFDGMSWVVDAQGRVLLRTPPFVEHLAVCDLDAENAPVLALPCDLVAEMYQALQLGLRDYVNTCGFQRVVVGLSGGIDSALTAVIAAEALGAERVVGVSMPSRYSSSGSREDAEALARTLGIEYLSIPIESLHTSALQCLEPHFAGRPPDITEENIQSRLRGLVLMALSNKFGWLVLTTGNKSELAMGYCTLYGDMCGGLSVIGDLPKMTVYALAHYINREREIIPWASVRKPPSAELRPNQKDTDTLPPYDVLDPILHLYVEEHKSPEQIIAAGYDPDLVTHVVRNVNRSEYKRQQAAQCLKVTSKAFGIGRRLPVAARFPDESPLAGFEGIVRESGG